MKVDDYINCSELIKKANYLYEIAIKQNLDNDIKLYLISMNKYINKYHYFRENLILTYIDDLRDYINLCLIIENDK